MLVVGEILNVLMDMYAEDDAHQNTFVAEGVLSYFQRVLPKFRLRTKDLSNSVSPEDQANLRETALNASRFVKYKINYMQSQNQKL